jgi:PAS domain S-box-containing protein
MKRTRILKRISRNAEQQKAASDPRGTANRSRSAVSSPATRPETAYSSPDDEVLFHLNSLLDSVKAGMISLDGEGRVRVFNAVAELLFGVPRQAVLGRTFSALGGIISLNDHSLRALWERLSDAVWAAGAALDLEYDLVRPLGQRRIISYSVYPLGQLTWSVGNGVVIILEDVTRKRELEEQITDARKRLQNVFDGITDGIQVVDTEFRITAVNKSMTALAGGSVIIGQRCYKVCGSPAGVCDDCPAVETFRSGQPASMVRRTPAGSGQQGDQEERILEISTFPLLDRGNRVQQVVEYIKDVTDRIRIAERLEQARRLAALGEMAARVAHEVRNPLNAITGAAHYLAAEHPEDETVRKFTDLIKRQSHRVDQVASDILHAARPLRLNRTTVDLDAVAEQAVQSFSEAIERQSILVDHQRVEGIPPIYADEVQVEQAVYNIIKNAVEAMPEGGTLAVRTGLEDQTGWVSLCIGDTGCGVRPEDRDRIFDAFFTTKAQGTGLGLSIVEGVLKNHGGMISFERQDADATGTRVVLKFPVREPSGQRTGSGANSASASVRPAARRRQGPP